MLKAYAWCPTPLYRWFLNLFLKNKFTVLRIIIIFSARCKFLIKNILTLFQLSVLKMLLTYFLLIYLYLLIYIKKRKIKNKNKKEKN